MSLLAAARRVALECGLELMDALPVDDRTAQELRAIADDVAARITESHDWQLLAREFVVPVGTTSFALPQDFDRFRQDAELYGDMGRRLSRVLSVEGRLSQPFPEAAGWYLNGNVLELTVPGGVSGTYQTSNRVVSADRSEARQHFIFDTDEFVLGDRLLSLGMVWRWKASRGLPYGQEYDEFERAMTLARGRDGFRDTVTVGIRRLPSDVTLAWPGVIIPDYTPPPNPVDPVDPVDPTDPEGPPVWDDNATWGE